MGTYLSTPVTDKCEESGKSLDCNETDVPVEWGVVDMQGWRKSMEDAHTAVTSVPIHSDGEKSLSSQARVFGVYDGHGGPEVARFCQHYFVSVLRHQESWNEGKELPLSKEDDRIPPPPPSPAVAYDGEGNELGYRSEHLPLACQTPVGKALREAFHSMDRMIDDPSRRNEIGLLRSTKPAKGETKSLENGMASIPPVVPASNETPPLFYTEGNKHMTAAAGTLASSTPSAAEGASTAPEIIVSSLNGDVDEGTKKQIDRSLSLAILPDEAEAIKTEIESFEATEAAEDGDKPSPESDSDADSNEPVGQEEAAALDNNIDDEDAADDTATNHQESSPGKVTNMLQKILSIGSEFHTPEIRTLIPEPTYPDATTVNGTSSRVPSVQHNGRLVCNLPDHPIHAGATAVVAVITGKILTVANAGDSRAVLCRRRKTASGGFYAYPMSYDHKPSQVHEKNRIFRSGGFVNHFGRINGNLNLSRSIGDLKYKQVPGIPPAHQMITAEPDIMQIALEEDDEFLILGCDGIWDCLTNTQAVDFVQQRINEKSPTEIGCEMLDQIISEDPRVTQGIGGDNMTIMIVDLQSQNRERSKAAKALEGDTAAGASLQQANE